MSLYKDIFIALAKNNIRYLVAGGFAVNFHQVVRSTIDLDLIIHLEEENILAFDRIMTDFGFKPRVPVTAKQFADPTNRREWMTTKNMKVFSYHNPKNLMEIVDVFVAEPRPFVDMERDRLLTEMFGVTIAVVGFDDLIAMKRKAGRPKDLFDIDELQRRKHGFPPAKK